MLDEVVSGYRYTCIMSIMFLFFFNIRYICTLLHGILYILIYKKRIFFFHFYVSTKYHYLVLINPYQKIHRLSPDLQIIIFIIFITFFIFLSNNCWIGGLLRLWYYGVLEFRMATMATQ